MEGAMNALTFFRLFLLSVLVSSVSIFSSTLSSAADSVDHRPFGELLGKYVKGGVVNYKGFKNDEALLDHYLRILEKTESKKLSRNEQFAFYVNAYNAWTLKLILTGYPGVKSIKDLGSFLKSPWKRKICRIDGELLSLDDIEHGILRPLFRDPRVHFAVNCASKGCPPLRSEPYRGVELDRQLDEMTTAFINDSRMNYLDEHILYVSSIFNWYKKDFDEDIPGFFLKYARGDLKRLLEVDVDKDRIEVKYLDYDWSLNGH